MERTLRLIVSGLVQGVGFRAFVAATARRHGVRGWVRNRRDRTVEAVLIGPSGSVDEVVAACGHGPTGAQVEAVDLFEADETVLAQAPLAGDFSILPTV